MDRADKFSKAYCPTEPGGGWKWLTPEDSGRQYDREQALVLSQLGPDQYSHAHGERLQTR